MAGGRVACPQSLAVAGVAGGDVVCRRSSHGDHWLRAAGVSDDFQDYYYFLARVGRKSESVATQLLVLVLANVPLPERVLLVIDDSPTKRYGPKVEGADVHHNPTPGPADQPFLYGHIWVTISLALRHPQWGALALPLRGMLYVRQQTIATIPKTAWLDVSPPSCNWRRGWWSGSFRSLKKAGKTVWVVVDGGYTKRPFLRRALKAGVVVVGRLRKDAALRDVPPVVRPGHKRRRGRPRKYGKNKISLAKRAGQKAAGKQSNARSTASASPRRQDLPGDLPAGRRRDSRRAREGRSWLVRFLLHRPRGQRRGDSGSLRRPGHDRTRLSRREGSLGLGPAAGAQHLDTTVAVFQL